MSSNIKQQKWLLKYLSHLYYVKVDGGVSNAVLDLLYGFSG